MPINILMPALSPTMEKGNLAKWLKKEGDKVKSGDVIAEIETDKATMEVEAVDEGTLAKIVVPEGTADVPVNQLIAVLAGEGEDVKAAAAQRRHRRARAEAAGRSRARSTGSSRGRRPRRRKPAPAPAAAPRLRPRAGRRRRRQAQGGGSRVFASPLARRLAKEAGIDVARVAGLRPAWPRHRARHRCGEVRQGPEAAPARRGCAGRARDRAGDVGRADPRAVRGGQLRGRAARRHAQASSRSGSRSRRRPSRISI